MATTRTSSADLAAIIAAAVADGVAAALASRSIPTPSEPDPVALSSAMAQSVATTERAARKAGKVTTSAPAGLPQPTPSEAAKSRYHKLIAHHEAIIANPESRAHAVTWSQQTVAMLTTLLAETGGYGAALAAFDSDRKARRERRAMKRDQAASNAAEIASLRAEIAKLRGK
jgi:hypothetical protein